MSPREEEEFELVLGNKQLLSLFFLVVVLFGVFFSFGYTVGYSRGENSPTRQVSSAEPIEPPSKKVELPETLLQEAPKPTGPTTPSTAAAPSESGEPASHEASVAEKKEPPAKETPKPKPTQQEPPKAAPPPVAKTSQPAPPKTAAPAKTTPPPKTAAAKPASPSQPAPAQDVTRSTHLQVAAVRVKQDAEVFVEQLRAKGYPAVVSDQGDGWYRVVVGPFKSEAEAQSYQKRLSDEGQRSLLRKR